MKKKRPTDSMNIEPGKPTPQEQIAYVIHAAGGIDAVARLVGCSYRTVTNWIEKGRFPIRPKLIEQTVRQAAERHASTSG